MDERVGIGGNEKVRRCRLFVEWIERNGLIDLGCSGTTYTWSRGTAENFKSARLDRGLVDEDWRLQFEEGAVRILPKEAWIHHDQFSEFVHNSWRNEEPLILFMKIFSKNMEAWNRNIFHNIFRKKSELWARLEGIQKDSRENLFQEENTSTEGNVYLLED
ncbi:uncharacterized protein [Spinacia oleracea]|uniref:Uncharacterized protein n=1 Tax=Spinacia oleracea TaxID=3562 RepID=A0ABM3QXQ6_SPIOL|nr:uncharacterized protein LOC130463123 [Spinacia oleracea]